MVYRHKFDFLSLYFFTTCFFRELMQRSLLCKTCVRVDVTALLLTMSASNGIVRCVHIYLWCSMSYGYTLMSQMHIGFFLLSTVSSVLLSTHYMIPVDHHSELPTEHLSMIPTKRLYMILIEPCSMIPIDHYSKWPTKLRSDFFQHYSRKLFEHRVMLPLEHRLV